MAREHIPPLGLLVVILTLALPVSADAQETGTITGTVVDETSGDPIPSAQVVLEGTGRGTLTNQQGAFLLQAVPAGEYVLAVLSLGYGDQSRAVNVTPGTTLREDFRLEQQAIRVGEIVVTGYQTRARRDQLGSLSQVGLAEMEAQAITTPDQVFQGLFSGTYAHSSTGAPGGGARIRIRGEGSIGAGNEPLYIVDGVQLNTLNTNRSEGGFIQNAAETSPLAYLDPGDIESVEVLKDAAAASIYGAQAANGVVLITTRRGQEGDTRFTVRSEYGMNEVIDERDVVRGPDWVRLQMEAFANRAEDLGQPRESGEQDAIALFGDPDEVGHYDWQGSIVAPARVNKLSVDMTGGSADSRYFLSASYDFEDGPMLGSNFERVSLRTNMDHQATDRLGVVVQGSLSKVEMDGDWNNAGCVTCPFTDAPSMRPTEPIRTEDGSFNQDLSPFPYSPAWHVRNIPMGQRTLQGVGSVTVNYAIGPRLNFRSLWGLDLRRRDEHIHRIPEQPIIGGTLTERRREFVNWMTNQVLSYETTLGGAHNLTGLVGVEYRNDRFSVLEAIGEDNPNRHLTTLDLAASGRVGGSTGGFKLASGFSRIEYDYMNRFLANATFRADGSSRFGQERRWGGFYSGSVGWNLMEEQLMLDRFGFMDNLTIRLSYGITGNNNIGDFAARTLFGSPGNRGSYRGQTALEPTQLGDELLTWETAKSTNLGITWSALAGRLNGSVDLYRTNNEDLLLGTFLPGDAGFNEVIRNAGVVRNQGIEVELGGVPLDMGDFSWRTQLNVSRTQNEIIKLVDGLENIGSTIRVGHPLRLYWGPEWAGVNPADGRPMWYDADGNITYTPSEADSRALGSRLPDWEGGLTNSVRYGPVQLGVQLHFVFGVELQDLRYDDLTDVASTRGLMTDAQRRWQQPGDVTDIPRAYTSSSQPGTASYTMFSSRFLFNGSFIRLRNVNLSYDVPSRLVRWLNGQSAQIYVRGRNLTTWTRFPGPDPEPMLATDDTYPSTRQLVTGIELRF